MTEFSRLNYDLHYAILSNSLSLVTYYLENGATASEPSPPLEKETQYSKTVLLKSITDSHRIYPIHVAITNYYHRMKGIDQEQNYASKIIDALLRHGADLDTKCTNISFLHVGIYESRNQPQPLTPLALLAFLRQTPLMGFEKYSVVMLDTLTEVLMKTKLVIDRDSKFKLPSSPTPKCTQRLYSNLYLSSKHSDIQFHCPGGVVLHAHKCILATASKYFDIAFSGEWQETTTITAPPPSKTITKTKTASPSKAITPSKSTPTKTTDTTTPTTESSDDSNGKSKSKKETFNPLQSSSDAATSPSSATPISQWDTTNPPEVMKAVLAFMYTGATLETYGAVNMRKLYQVASEYQLNALCQLCEQWCVAKISVNNFRDMVYLAHLHTAKKLKEACHQFAKQHPQVLLDEGFLQIQTESPELWEELKHAIKRKLV